MTTADDLRNIALNDDQRFEVEWKVQLIERLGKIAEALERFSSMIEDCLSAEGDAIDVRVNSDAV